MLQRIRKNLAVPKLWDAVIQRKPLGGARMKRRARLCIGGIEHRSKDGVHRVSADVGGTNIWFESEDLELRPAPEAYASLFLLPAMSARMDLVVEDGLDGRWQDNALQLMRIFGTWWRYGDIGIHARRIASRSRQERMSTSQFLSGGIDSFFTLQQRSDEIDNVVYMHGMEVPAYTFHKVKRIRTFLEAVAREFNVHPVVIRTNLDSHPLYRNVHTLRACGGAFAAVGHVQRGVGRVVIAASAHDSQLRPWGTHPHTDPLYSSSACTFEHFGTRFTRLEKIRSVVDSPLLQQHLHVCMIGTDPRLNCGECETCLRMMTTLRSLGMLDRFVTLPQDKDLPALIDRIYPLPEPLSFFWEELDLSTLPPDHRRAVHQMLQRNRWRYTSQGRALVSLVRRIRGRPDIP